MRNWLRLFVGDFNRYIKYNLLAASLLVVILYGVMFYFLDEGLVRNLLPVFLFFELFVMPMLFLGVELYYEKQEGTLRTMLVAPVNKYQILGAKYLVAIVAALISFSLLTVIAFLLYDITPNFLVLFLVAIISLIFAIATGLLLAYQSLDFSRLFMNYIVLVLGLYLPVVVYQFNFYRAEWFKILIDYLPPQSINNLLAYSYNSLALEDVWFSFIYIVVLGVGLSLLAFRLFDKFAEH
jgi:fluoroquinolone transport system permease protein